MIVATFRRAYAALERFGAFMFRQMDALYERAWRVRRERGRGFEMRAKWPVTAGAYVVGDPSQSRVGLSRAISVSRRSS
jgi:hypothetical protein